MALKRSKKNVSNCPTCGIYLCPAYQKILADDPGRLPEDIRNHQCDPDFLRRSAASRDGALLRDPDEEDPRERCVGERLAEGFEMLNEEDA